MIVQGTVLGLQLFIIFVDDNDMSEVVEHSIYIKLFADDSKLSKDIRCMLDQMIDVSITLTATTKKFALTTRRARV